MRTAALVTEDLTGRGFDVTNAYDGHEGFVSILQNVPDLILCDIKLPHLCDIKLPHLSGFELLECLNALAPRLGHVPVRVSHGARGSRHRIAGATPWSRKSHA